MIRVVKLSFDSRYTDQFRQLFADRKEMIRNFPGCTWLELWQDHADPNIFYTYSLWNEASDLEEYRISDLFQDTWAQVKQWFSAPPQAFSADKLLTL